LQVCEFIQKEDQGFRCELCPHKCLLETGATGICGVRQNIGGEVVSLNYGKITALAMDPIEKKPLYHYYPGTRILSVGSTGCNFHCDFCQNWTVARGKVPSVDVTPWDLISKAQRKDNIGIAFTYAEPLMWYEFLRETMPKVQEKGLKTVLVTNGYINSKPLQKILPNLNAVNLDIKFFARGSYRRYCGGDLKQILNNALEFKKNGHLEITTLIIPDINDSPEEIDRLVSWIKENLGSDTPFHLSRYYPAYRFNTPPPSIETLIDLYYLARESLDYVYLGNIREAEFQHTYCPRCNHLLIKRGFGVQIRIEEGNTCPECGQLIHIIK